MNIYNEQRRKVSTATLANATEVVARVILSISGNDISNKMGNSNITLSSLRGLALARLQAKLKV